MAAASERRVTMVGIFLFVVFIVGLSFSVLRYVSNVWPSNDDKRLAQLNELQQIFLRYRNAHQGQFPPVAKDKTFCLGFDEGKRCWPAAKIPPQGNRALNEAIGSFSVIPTDPAPDRTYGNAYLYIDGEQLRGCSTANRIEGRFILWEPEQLAGDSQSCLGKGFLSCCGASGNLCDGPYYCAFQIDEKRVDSN